MDGSTTLHPNTNDLYELIQIINNKMKNEKLNIIRLCKDFLWSYVVPGHLALCFFFFLCCRLSSDLLFYDTLSFQLLSLFYTILPLIMGFIFCVRVINVSLLYSSSSNIIFAIEFSYFNYGLFFMCFFLFSFM